MALRANKPGCAWLAAAAALACLACAAPASAAGPTAVAADSDGTVYAGFAEPGPIKRFNSEGTPLTAWGSPGPAAGQLGGIVALDVAPGPGGTVWVLDTNLRVQEFSRSGTYIRGITLAACDPGVSTAPRERGGLDVTNDAVFVAHPCADSLIRLRRSDLVQTATVAVDDPKGVSAQLYDSAPANTRYLYVALPNANQIRLFDRSSLAPVFSVGIPGSPTDVFIDAFGVMFVSDRTANVIRQYGTDGVEFRTVGGPGTAAGKLDDPTAIDVFEQFGGSLAGNVFVADYGNARIQRWNSFEYTFWTAPADSSNPGAPVNQTLPQVQGTPAIGQQLTCTTGTWSPAATSYGYSWARDGVTLGASQSQYTVVGGDGGHQLSCAVTATNAVGSGQASSEPVAVSAAPQPPVNVVRPQLSGVAMVNEQLSCSQGSWNNAPTAYAYEWRRGGAPIGGAASATYTLQDLDEGAQIRCAVTASNGVGPATAVSDPVVPVAGQAPANATAPQITGTPTVGRQLACSPGTWQNSPSSFAFEWRRDGDPFGETTSTHTVVDADVGAQLRCAVTATNGTGSSTALSAAVTGAPAPITPVNAAAPQISGTAIGGETLSCTPGSWLNEPTAFTYSWSRDGVDVAATPSLALGDADVGAAVTCAVRAANDAGAASATSQAVTVGAAGSAPVGVSIEGGKPYVASPEVELTAHEPRGATAILIADDAAFGDPQRRRIAADDSYPWTLAGGGSDERPRGVYVRFEGAGVDPGATYSDDVVVDRTRPRTLKARLAGRSKGRRLLLRASDPISGIGAVDLAFGGGDNFVRHRWSRTIRGRNLGRVIFVRAIDGAGNLGNWVRVQRRR